MLFVCFKFKMVKFFLKNFVGSIHLTRLNADCEIVHKEPLQMWKIRELFTKKKKKLLKQKFGNNKNKILNVEKFY